MKKITFLIIIVLMFSVTYSTEEVQIVERGFHKYETLKYVNKDVLSALFQKDNTGKDLGEGYFTRIELKGTGGGNNSHAEYIFSMAKTPELVYANLYTDADDAPNFARCKLGKLDEPDKENPPSYISLFDLPQGRWKEIPDNYISETLHVMIDPNSRNNGFGVIWLRHDEYVKCDISEYFSINFPESGWSPLYVSYYTNKKVNNIEFIDKENNSEISWNDIIDFKSDKKLKVRLTSNEIDNSKEFVDINIYWSNSIDQKGEPLFLRLDKKESFIFENEFYLSEITGLKEEINSNAFTICEVGNNSKDSEKLLEILKKQKVKVHGYAEKIKIPDNYFKIPSDLNDKNGKIVPSVNYMKKAGVITLTAEFIDNDINISDNILINARANIVYYSGHGYHNKGAYGKLVYESSTNERFIDSLILTQPDWNFVDTAIFAACSVLDIKDYNKRFKDEGHFDSPGEKWFNKDWKKRTLLGYNSKAPSYKDDIIISNFLKNINYNFSDENKIITEWLKSNKNSWGIFFKEKYSIKYPSIDLLGKNSCAISKTGDYYYLKHRKVFGRFFMVKNIEKIEYDKWKNSEVRENKHNEEYDFSENIVYISNYQQRDNNIEEYIQKINELKDNIHLLERDDFRIKDKEIQKFLNTLKKIDEFEEICEEFENKDDFLEALKNINKELDLYIEKNLKSRFTPVSILYLSIFKAMQEPMESIEYLDDFIESYKCDEYYKKLASVIKSEILYELGMKEKAEELLNEILVNHNEPLLNELLDSMSERVSG